MDDPLVLMTVPAEPSSVPLVRHAVSGLGATDGWDPAFLTDVSVAVTEACENAVAHGYPDSAPGSVAVSIHLEGSRLTVRVVDDGVGFPAPAPGDDRREGLGLMLMAALSDDLAIASPVGGPTDLRLTFHVVRVDGSQ